MSRTGQDPLWPLLIGLAALLGGALTLERVAREREARGSVVRIERGAAATFLQVGDDDDDANEEPEFEMQQAAGEEHERARAICRRQQATECLAAFEKLVAAHADSALIHAEYGFWLLRNQKTDAAVGELERAHALDPSSPLIVLNLGAARRRAGDRAGAEREFRRALELKPNYGSAKLALGQALRARGEIDEAERVLKDAAASGSNDLRARALAMLGRVYLTRGDRVEAERAFESAIERAPASVELRLRIARHYLNGGKLADRNKALDHASKVALMAPDDAEVQTAVGRIAERAGDDAVAFAAYERAVQLDPKQRYATRRLLRLALENENFEQAEACAAKLLAADPADPEHHFLAGLVAAREGKSTQAREHYLEAIRASKTGYPEASFNLGILEKRLGDLEQAVKAYREAVRLRPNYVAAWNNLGVALAALGQSKEAEEAYKNAIAADGSYASAWVNLAELQGQAGRSGDAVQALEQAARIRPDLATRIALARARETSGGLDAALADYRVLVQEHPRHAPAWSGLGRALLAKKDPSAARQAIEKAIALAPDDPEYLSALAGVELALGRLDQARRAYEDVLDHVPSDHRARLALAEVLRRSNDGAGCEREVQRVLAAEPQNEAALRLRGECRVATAQR